MSKKTNYSIYVIELDKSILDLKKFREENPDIFLLAHAKKKILKEPDRILCIEKKSGS